MFRELDQMRVAIKPRPGYFKMRLKARSPVWLPASIYTDIPFDPVTGEILDRPTRLAAEHCGNERAVEDVWQYGQEISREEYKWLIALNAIRMR